MSARQASRSADRLTLARTVGLNVRFVDGYDVWLGVDGREVQHAAADVAHLMSDAFGHDREPTRPRQRALLADRDLGLAGQHHDDLLRTIGVTRQATACIDLEPGAAGAL